MSTEHLVVPATDGTPMAATRRRGAGQSVVLLHAGVADRRSWAGVSELLGADDLDVVAYDRRGYGERSEERRVGKECEVPCRSRWSPYH